MAGVYDEDRFFIDLQHDRVIWIYQNWNNVNGEHFVQNIFESSLLKKALEECSAGTESEFDPETVYEYLEERCRQHLIDVDADDYSAVKEEFLSPPVSIGLTRRTMDTLALLFHAKELIDQYCMEEFGDHADFSDLSKIGIAYTTTEDEKHEIQAFANLESYCTEVYLDGDLVATQRSESLQDYVDNRLPYLDFNELVDIPEWVIDKHLRRGVFRKDLRFMQHQFWGMVCNLCIEAGSYQYGGGPALELYNRSEDDLEPYCNLTVNIDAVRSGPDCAYIDTNNFSTAMELIEEYKLGKPTGRIGTSGYCHYPEYRFDMKELRKYCLNSEELEKFFGEKQNSERREEERY